MSARSIVVIGLCAVCLVCLFPPRTLPGGARGPRTFVGVNRVKATITHEYSGSGISGRSTSTGSVHLGVDTGRMAVEVLIIAIVAAGIAFCVSQTGQKEESIAGNSPTDDPPTEEAGD